MLRETLLTSASAAVGVTSVGLYGIGEIGHRARRGALP